MGHVNLLSNDVWSDRDLADLATAIIRTRFTAEDELKAARLARKAEKTEADIAYIEQVDQAIAAALSESADARRDNALLIGVLAFEAGYPDISEAGLELYERRKEYVGSNQGSSQEQDLRDSAGTNRPDDSGSEPAPSDLTGPSTVAILPDLGVADSNADAA